MRKLYNVTLETVIVVLADSPEQAEELGREALDEGDHDPDAHAMPLTSLLYGWVPDAIPFGLRDESEPDLTIGDWIKRGAAPGFKTEEEKP